MTTTGNGNHSAGTKYHTESVEWETPTREYFYKFHEKLSFVNLFSANIVHTPYTYTLAGKFMHNDGIDGQ